MGILSGVFGSKSENKEIPKINWIQLTNEGQLEDLKKTSVLFKHSTRCGISSSVIKRFEKQHGSAETNVDFYYLDLLNFRNISQAIAEKFQVIHESPQAVVIKNNELVAHASHYDILELNLVALD
ncbi:bacillithiol system redox-active protein YtxJ [Flavicella marina]|uniref:bacillithiol system redox-active protein YtxJ n=1 Tax=Flavicella marina TaxID=1475951 RepID=UPI001263EDFE|nr:bacillithiol system redox-active protein YtxJ [Flavicella marina]